MLTSHKMWCARSAHIVSFLARYCGTFTCSFREFCTNEIEYRSICCHCEYFSRVDTTAKYSRCQKSGPALLFWVKLYPMSLSYM